MKTKSTTQLIRAIASGNIAQMQRKTENFILVICLIQNIDGQLYVTQETHLSNEGDVTTILETPRLVTS